MAALEDTDDVNPSPGTADTATDEDANPSVGADLIHVGGPTVSAQLNSSLQTFWQSRTLTDVTLVSRGRRFPVHGVVIAAYSNCLREQLLNLGPPVQGQRELTVDVQPGILEMILEFMYKGELNVPSTHVRDLKNAAHLLGISSLRDECQKALYENTSVTADNCLEMWSAAESLQDQQLLDRAKPVALANFSDIWHQNDFTQLSAQCIQEYLGHPDLQLSDRDETLAAALTWVEADEHARGQHLCDVLDVLPLQEMGWILNQALHKRVVTANPEAKRKIERAVQRRRTSASATRRPAAVPAPVSDTSARPAVESKRCLVIFGHQKGTNVGFCNFEDPSDEVIVVQLEHNYMMVTLGAFGSEFPKFSNGCVMDNKIYTGGIGPSRQELWHFNVENSSSSRLPRVR